MKRNQLSDMSIFVEVARANGFRAAAENLKLGAGSVSEAVQRLEDRIGVRLFDRTTRKISLTTLGHQLYERSLPAINDLESAVTELRESKGTVAGTLMLNAPRICGVFFLDTLIAEYAVAYPEANVEITYNDERVDLVTSNVDAVIRSQHLLEKDTFAIPIGPEITMTIVASPAYLERSGVPQVPEDILVHEGICFSIGDAKRLVPWQFNNNSSSYSVALKPRMVVNDLTSMLSFTKAGLGLTYVYRDTVMPLIESGELVEVLKGQVPSLPRYTINYLSKRHMPARLRAFIDFAKAKN